MTILEKLHVIESKKIIYDIHYCRAGIGFLFYDPPQGRDMIDSGNKEWKQYLKVERYYPTFEDAVKAEYKKLL